MGIKSKIKAVGIICSICVLLVPVMTLLYFFTNWVIELNNIVLMGLLGIFNIVILALVSFVFYLFLRNEKLRSELIDALWFFLLVIFPLILAAGIIEGLLVGLVG